MLLKKLSSDEYEKLFSKDILLEETLVASGVKHSAKIIPLPYELITNKTITHYVRTAGQNILLLKDDIKLFVVEELKENELVYIEIKNGKIEKIYNRKIHQLKFYDLNKITEQEIIQKIDLQTERSADLLFHSSLIFGAIGGSISFAGICVALNLSSTSGILGGLAFLGITIAETIRYHKKVSSDIENTKNHLIASLKENNIQQ